jgi:CheY-like chemotaxis protein
MNILIVDDDSTDVRFLQELLMEADAGSSRLVHVENLRTALQRLQEELFDIVLLDFRMCPSYS